MRSFQPRLRDSPAGGSDRAQNGHGRQNVVELKQLFFQQSQGNEEN